MIKFFRKIRRRLLTENKFTKYLIYAIGEIVLVVIGILIALQINNWNELNKQQQEEIKMLQNFKMSIQGDFEEFNRYKRFFDGADKSIYILLEHMEEDLAFHDSLRHHFRMTTSLWSPKIDQEVFASMTSSDLNIISNDSLKSAIITYYSFAKRTFDVRMNRYADIIGHAGKEIFNTRFNEMWGNTWDDPDYLEIQSQKTMTPINYEQLKRDQEYHYFLKSLKNQLYWYVRLVMDDGLENSEKLIALIDEELETLED